MTRSKTPPKTAFVRELRGELTEAEKVLWSRLSNRQLHCKFRRQHGIGPFVVDFVCLAHKYVVEADGGQHVDSLYDEAGTRWLERRGFTVIRFRNHEILGNLEMVTSTIAGHIP